MKNGFKDEQFQSYGGSLKNPIFTGGGGGVRKTNISGGGLDSLTLNIFHTLF